MIGLYKQSVSLFPGVLLIHGKRAPEFLEGGGIQPVYLFTLPTDLKIIYRQDARRMVKGI